MVWARSKLAILDDLTTPRARIHIDFRGREPQRLYREIPQMIATVFRVHSGAVQEKKFVMHKGDPEKFKADWEIIKDIDKFSFYKIGVSISGQSSKGVGEATVTITGSLRTEYPQDTVWQRSLFYEILRMFWHSMFYTAKRSRYLAEGRQLITMFADDVKHLTKV